MFDPDRDDLERRIEAHAAFHLAVAAATGNSLLGLVVRPLYSMSDRRAVELVAPLPFWRTVDRDHRDLLASIRDGDVPRSMELARAHIDNVRPAV
jgi:GntR family transcriptional repressor for pyruvate dehydrogenase complex